jgi:DNA/RNA-binding domain of Phe-tRNA-synthetase-like protein
MAAIVRPGWLTMDGLAVLERDARMDEPLQLAAAALRAGAQGTDAAADPTTSAVRTMYKKVGLDPTKTRPSSEALLRRVARGDALPRINSLVDVINWCSVESRLPFGLYDLDRIRGGVTLRVGQPGEEYAGIRKDVVHVAGRLVLSDADGPFGNPSSDSARTMTTTSTSRALVVIFAPVSVSTTASERALATTRERIERFCVKGA